MAAKLVFGVLLFASAAVAQPGAGVDSYSIEKEVALGRQVAAEFRRNTQALDAPAVLAYVDAIGQRLVAAAGGPPFTYTFALVADDPSAMHEPAAFPGGFVFVPASLILAAKDEDEFTGMLAHAIAHVASRQGTQAAANATLVFMGGWTGSAVPRGFLERRRRFELQADGLAARSMSAAGWDPAALARYIERLRPGDERVEGIVQTIGELPVRAYGRHEGFEKIQAQVRQLLGSAKKPPSLFRPAGLAQ